MKRRSTYEAARIVAPAIHTHFGRLVAEAQASGAENVSSPPDVATIETMIDTSFWTSLSREEGLSPRISLAWVNPEQAGNPLMFQHRLPLTTQALIKIAPGMERSGIYLGVWHDKDQLYVWGSTSHLPDFCLVLDVSEPGLLVVKHRRVHGFGKFANVAVLTGDQVKLVNEAQASDPDCPAMLASLLKFSGNTIWNNSVNVLVQMAVSMRAHKRGGAILVTPLDATGWQHSIVQPMGYPLQPSFSGLTGLLQQNPSEEEHPGLLEVLNHEIDLIAGLTAVDGATIINDNYEVLAFGAKIGRVDGKGAVNKVLLTEPVMNVEPEEIHPAKMGGTRHLSAAQFVYDQQDCMAMVASQDGRFTIFSWSPCEKIVQAHRIDTLLL
ncbi:MAG: putative sensor domain DACNV-containing protein [Bacteroidia bacterium]